MASAVDTLNWVDNLTRRERSSSEHSYSKRSAQEISTDLEPVRLNGVNRPGKERSNSEISYSSTRSDQENSDNLEEERLVGQIKKPKKRKHEVWISADTGNY